MKLFKAQDVRNVCRGVTQRMLDYWVDSGVIRPTAHIKSQRRIYLFDFEDIVRIKIVRSLRDAGVSLQRVRIAIRGLEAANGARWQAAWLITDGKRIYRARKSPTIIESLSKGEMGQLVFSAIALGSLKDQVERRLARCAPVNLSRYEGALKWCPGRSGHSPGKIGSARSKVSRRTG